MTEAPSRLLLAIAILATAGLAVSSVSLAHHYGTSKTAYCDFGEAFNCDVVNRSAYSTLLGVPVALVGIVGYLALLLLATAYRNLRGVRTILFLGSIAGLAFALYLTFIEGFVLNAWCLLCLSSLGLIGAITVLSLMAYLKKGRTRSA